MGLALSPRSRSHQGGINHPRVTWLFPSHSPGRLRYDSAKLHNSPVHLDMKERVLKETQMRAITQRSSRRGLAKLSVVPRGRTWGWKGRGAAVAAGPERSGTTCQDAQVLLTSAAGRGTWLEPRRLDNGKALRFLSVPSNRTPGFGKGCGVSGSVRWGLAAGVDRRVPHGTVVSRFLPSGASGRQRPCAQWPRPATRCCWRGGPQGLVSVGF